MSKGRPNNWSKAVIAAGRRLLGDTQGEAAKAAGVGRDTVNRWEQSDWWHEAVREADVEWMGDLMAAARRAVLEAVQQGDASLGFKILERTHDRLQERKQVEVSTRTYRVEMPTLEAEVLSIGSDDE